MGQQQFVSADDMIIANNHKVSNNNIQSPSSNNLNSPPVQYSTTLPSWSTSTCPNNTNNDSNNPSLSPPPSPKKKFLSQLVKKIKTTTSPEKKNQLVHDHYQLPTSTTLSHHQQATSSSSTPALSINNNNRSRSNSINVNNLNNSYDDSFSISSPNNNNCEFKSASLNANVHYHNHHQQYITNTGAGGSSGGIPLSSDGQYTYSFSLESLNEEMSMMAIRSFFEQFGFVIIRNVLSPEQIDRSIEEIWSIIEGRDESTISVMESLKSFQPSFIPANRQDPTTWKEECGWPSFSQVGILGNQPALGRCAMENRQNENIYKIFNFLIGGGKKTSLHGSAGASNGLLQPHQRINSLSYSPQSPSPSSSNVLLNGNNGSIGCSGCGSFGTSPQQLFQISKNSTGSNGSRNNSCQSQKLWCGFDTYGVMRPTKQILLKDGKTKRDFPQYKTNDNWLHWRLNPWKLYKEYQALKNNVKKFSVTQQQQQQMGSSCGNCFGGEHSSYYDQDYSIYSEGYSNSSSPLSSSIITNNNNNLPTNESNSESSNSTQSNSGGKKKQSTTTSAPYEKSLLQLKTCTGRKFLLNEDFGLFKALSQQSNVNYNYVNPRVDYMGSEVKLQAMINFIDSKEQDGGLMLVPSFHTQFLSYAKATFKKFSGKSDHLDNFVKVPPGFHHLDLHRMAKPISLPAGSIIIWDSRIPTCTYQNDSDKFHMVQYLRMFKCEKYITPQQQQQQTSNNNESSSSSSSSAASHTTNPSQLFELRRQLIEKSLPKDFELTPHGRKLFGLEKW